MKRCPICNQTYQDNEGNFCIRDGGKLAVVGAEAQTPPPSQPQQPGPPHPGQPPMPGQYQQAPPPGYQQAPPPGYQPGPPPGQGGYQQHPGQPGPPPPVPPGPPMPPPGAYPPGGGPMPGQPYQAQAPPGYQQPHPQVPPIIPVPVVVQPGPQGQQAPPPSPGGQPGAAQSPAGQVVKHQAPAAADSHQRIKCEWCQGQNESSALACRACGAPLDIKNLVSESGWREAPRIKDMTEIHFGRSTCQVEGEIVPVAEINLGQGDSVYFEHHVLLWKDDTTGMSVMSLQGGMKRALAGMPFIISLAHGPGRIAFSRDATGELVVLPLHPGMEVDVREHAFLLASHHIGYSYVRIKGLRNILFGGQGMFMDRFVTGNEPGLLILHGYGNVFERMLKPGESIIVEPGAFLYKDSTVTMDVEFQKLGSGFFGGGGMNLARMTGPGRVGIQSMYVHHNTE